MAHLAQRFVRGREKTRSDTEREVKAVMRAKVWHWGLALAMVIINPAVSSLGMASEALVRTVRGAVIATNLQDDPQTIVVKVIVQNKEELIVGARVPADTRITRGKHPTTLAEIKAGESVEFTYHKVSDGLVARSIHVR